MPSFRLSRLYNALILRLTAPRPAQRATARSLEILFQFPEELMKPIFDQLSQGDLCSLTLTCHAMENYLGPLHHHWRRCSKSEERRFLVHYAQRFPDHLPCFSCLRLHQSINMPLPGPIGKDVETGSTSHGPSLFLIQDLPEYHFDFISLQIVMQAYQRDTSTRSIDSLSARFIADLTDDELFPRKELTSVDAMVIKGSLYMRVQRWVYVISAKDMTRCIDSCYRSISKSPTAPACPHQDGSMLFWTWWLKPSWHNPGFLSKSSKPTRCGFTTCKICQVSTQELYLLAGREGGQAFVLTIWVDLGIGTLGDSTNEIWTPTHPIGNPFETLDLRGLSSFRRPVEQSYCDEIYGTHAELSLEDLTRRNDGLITDRLLLRSRTQRLFGRIKSLIESFVVRLRRGGS